MKTELKDTPAGDPDLSAAQRVLALEIEGIATLSRQLDESFVQALDLLSAIEGRIVVTGIGKSGHIGCKIAATLSSTGTPALFVHPAEASHGDLGMITGGDAILAISNSGETEELSDLVQYSRRFSIPLVAITCRAESALAEAADMVLLVPRSAEACPMGLAPTTSTTVTLALGDAIAVALLERKGFSKDDFHILHPGGKLGRRLLRVSDIMHKGDEMPLVRGEATMQEALLEMTGKRLGCMGILSDDGRLAGIVTDGDLRRHMQDDLLARTAGEIMTCDPCTIRPQALAAEALNLMNGRKITVLFVVEDERPIGIIHMHDIYRAGVA
ncbi:MAG: KpsF/GutQ family sugar-phosphate isomerase [Alphaproteobacteria bacterium]|nr:KpsF/GutQ family sugar-phosphate isomerase [Alphaproteobacteria bacterium]